MCPESVSSSFVKRVARDKMASESGERGRHNVRVTILVDVDDAGLA
jgi:hypothetical protein